MFGEEEDGWRHRLQGEWLRIEDEARADAETGRETSEDIRVG